MRGARLGRNTIFSALFLIGFGVQASAAPVPEGLKKPLTGELYRTICGCLHYTDASSSGLDRWGDTKWVDNSLYLLRPDTGPEAFLPLHLYVAGTFRTQEAAQALADQLDAKGQPSSTKFDPVASLRCAGVRSTPSLDMEEGSPTNFRTDRRLFVIWTGVFFKVVTYSFPRAPMRSTFFDDGYMGQCEVMKFDGDEAVEFRDWLKARIGVDLGTLLAG